MRQKSGWWHYLNKTWLLAEGVEYESFPLKFYATTNSMLQHSNTRFISLKLIYMI